MLSRVEDAGLNASAPSQQRWLDGWLVRYSPGKAKRARCINAVAPGRLPLAEKLRLAADVFAGAGLPLLVRITPFTLPATLDQRLGSMGMTTLDDTRVWVHPAFGAPTPPPAPPDTEWCTLGPSAFAEAVGALRGSPPEQRLAHAQRLAASPVPYSGHALRRQSDAAVLACGQVAQEAELVGLYDVHTHADARGRGLATLLCQRLLALSAMQGARVAYLQVEADNAAAMNVYRRLGFRERYAYHYRQAAET